jgi:UDP-2,4-diacetamido-2,4,6-trideoxy-beta-L-altropyranose hydrolase
MSEVFTQTKTSLMNVVIRADAGPAVGTGHVMRMMALGEACCKLGASVTMLCGDIPSGLVQRLFSCGIDVYQLNCDQCDDEDARETLAFAVRENADWIVLDGYGFNAAYQQAVSESNAELMMMDEGDLADSKFVDVILNQNAYAKTDANDANRLAGCDFTLLRSEFLSANACEPKKIRQFARRILVTFGGCDDANWTQRALQSLLISRAQDLIVDVVVGAGYQHLEALLELKREHPASIRIHRNVDRMVDVMWRADFAITAGGSTCYELARCGVPALAIPVAENQIPIVEALSGMEALVAFEPTGCDEEDVSQMSKVVGKLLRDSESRARMSELGQALVDGQGAFRMARRMANWGVTFRNANLDDAEQLLAWRNDPEVRSVLFDTDQVSLATYQTWLGRKLDKDDCCLWIAETSKGQPIGQVRLDFDSSQQASICLSLDHTRRAKGLGRAIIEKACELGFEENPQLDSIVAQITPGNVASERAFRSVGFVQTQPTMVNKKLAFQFVLWRDAKQQKRRSAA